ncbi:HpcH/HpaI aldolase/citrate lyase family protein [Sphingosinicella sp.]|uniref:HpcH/HpaI aldolase family protein n=1 Tax=Sphingosinicella sp. TaxID=1917971 RepID=UPI0035B0FA24
MVVENSSGRLPGGLGLWLSSPNLLLLELSVQKSVDVIVLDLEHGSFDLATLDSFLCLARSLELVVLAKTLSPERASIQQPLDFGSAAVIIPHVGNVDHARCVTGFAKYPPSGTRSSSGGRSFHYRTPADDFFDRQNRETFCLPMIETAEALEAVEAIAALETVDGLFVGPTDLSLRRGRGRYRRTDEDRSDLERIACAAAAAGKPWIMPAWTPLERDWAQTLGAHLLIVAEEQAILSQGLDAALSNARNG